MHRARALFLVVVSALMALAPACNILVTVERCKMDGECPAGYTCDPEGRFCLQNAAEAASDAPADAPLSGAQDARSEDVGIDAPFECSITGTFGAPVLVKGLENVAISSARFTPDETRVLFAALNGCAQEHCVDLFVATRSDRNAVFGPANPLPSVNTSASAEYWPTISADGLLLFFESARSLEKQDGGYVNDQARIWSSTRVNTIAEFGEPRIQSIFAVSGIEGSPYLHPSGKSLYFMSGARPGKGNFDIFVAQLDGLGLASAVSNVDAVNTAAGELAPVVSLNERALYFAREAPVTTIRDIFVSTRSSPTAQWAGAMPVTELNSDKEEFPSWLSDDQCRLYFVSDRPSGTDASAGAARLWVATRTQ